MNLECSIVVHTKQNMVVGVNKIHRFHNLGDVQLDSLVYDVVSIAIGVY